MNAIIGGKRYDTETATEIISRETVSEYMAAKESLYLSPNEQLFIASYAITGEEDHIRLVNERSAMEWLENGNAPQSAYEAAGIEIEEG